MPSLSAAAKATIAAALAEAGHGQRGAEARRLGALYGVSVATIYRVAGRRGTKRPRPAARPEYREWTRIAVALSHQAPKPVPLDLALRAGVESGALPPEAAAMPVRTLHRLVRELGLAARPKRTHRLHADYPMQAVQIDGSSSEHLVVEHVLEDGDVMLALHRRPYSASGYKNKPLGPDRLRVLVYALWDMCTGYTLSRYCVARGERSIDALEFLCWALARHDDARIPLFGVPDDLWSDQGPLFKSGPAADLLDRLDIHLVTGKPYAKERMGGVERTHRTRWTRFERALFLRGEDTIRLSELNARLSEFEIEHNASRPSRTPVAGRAASRTAAWIALTNGRPADHPLRQLPPDPIETLSQVARRKVDQNGLVRWDNVEYEVARLHSCWVVAHRAIDGTGNLVVEDERSGERHVAVRYQARGYGEIRGVPATPLAQLSPPAEESAADLYAPRDPEASNVRAIPSRSAPAAPLDNPRDAGRYRDLDAAMRAFVALYPHPLSPANRELVIEHLTDRELDKQAVIELAQELSVLPKAAKE